MPIFDERQRAALDRWRREHTLESSRMTPSERLRRSDEMRQMAEALRPGGRTRSDESLEIMRRWKRPVEGV